MKNIYLIGFMGSGKTTIGKKLSSSLNLNFIDTDNEIERRNLMSIKDIFRIKGELFFRNEEAKLIKDISKLKNTIISTGGGLPCYNNLIENLNDSGITIYLNYDIDTLYQKLKNDDIRPLLNKKENEFKIYIKDLLFERKKHYNKSKHNILCNNLKKDIILRQINSLIVS